MIARVLIGAVRVYQIAVSPLLPPACRYYPSCSEYTAQALAAHGPLWGLWLGARRLVRCHPWHEGGVDPVPGRVELPRWLRPRPAPPRADAHGGDSALPGEPLPGGGPRP